MPSPLPRASFMDYVQLHERSWGTLMYPGRPSLQQILQARVVVFWKDRNEKSRGWVTVSLYNSMADVEKYFVSLLLRASIAHPDKYVARIFQDKTEIKLVNMKMEYKIVDS